MVKEINKDNFNEEVLNSSEVVLVDFYANWCGPCKMLSPIMDSISSDIRVCKVNVDTDVDLASEYGISSIPCVIAFKDGKEIDRSIGLRSKEDILKMVN